MSFRYIVGIWNPEFVDLSVVIVPMPDYCSLVHFIGTFASESFDHTVDLSKWSIEVVDVVRYARTTSIVDSYRSRLSVSVEVRHVHSNLFSL